MFWMFGENENYDVGERKKTLNSVNRTILQAKKRTNAQTTNYELVVDIKAG